MYLRGKQGLGEEVTSQLRALQGSSTTEIIKFGVSFPLPLFTHEEMPERLSHLSHVLTLSQPRYTRHAHLTCAQETTEIPTFTSVLNTLEPGLAKEKQRSSSSSPPTVPKVAVSY